MKSILGQNCNIPLYCNDRCTNKYLLVLYVFISKYQYVFIIFKISSQYFICLVFSSMLSDEQNQEIFSKCNNANGHGHNYTGNIYNVRHRFTVLSCACFYKANIEVAYFSKGEILY